MSVAARKKFFTNNTNLNRFSFNPDYIYSFSFFQHILNVKTFEIETPLFNYDLLKIIGKQPLECMAVIWSPEVVSQTTATASATT